MISFISKCFLFCAYLSDFNLVSRGAPLRFSNLIVYVFLGGNGCPRRIHLFARY